MIYRAQYDSPFGTLTITCDGESLKELRFSDTPIRETIMNYTNIHELTSTDPTIPIVEETRRWLDCYFNGKNPGFTPQVAPFGTLFHRRVWFELMDIPFGETASYGDIARRVDCRSAQAIGGAVGANPIAIIIPCHRVVGSDGSLTGYAYGLKRKRRLLMLEQKTRNYGIKS